MKIRALALVAAILIVTPGVTIAEDRQKLGGSAQAEDEAARRYFTDAELVDQNGTPRRFYSDLIRGRKVLINFAFTACKGVCPTMTANLAKVQKLLGKRVGTEVTILTITVDPVNDTPAALKRYAEQFKAGPGWLFLSGAPENVNAVLKKLGGLAPRPEEHSSVLLVGDAATGYWVKTAAVDQPESIVALIDHINDRL